ncbi:MULTISPECIES: molybdopterin-dependent oxidoreductase [unclassified Pseudodesulfovibrio]|uniref:molybdopterin-containing oxidoreductase family protein n=1 Tax=unclassified Pseudodesulfovibrio TaxID=2661612 RepID=UPI000FEB6E4F|nr:MULTISPECIES: molybdopterin-dependent oxidoreductase [unclassified Pseudodesulfovibrio]MCJ2164302.1 molybdopterin-dependent oxidoreductase [Pseudodesulfovibrio sp. S3-i]RWU04513.1 hypothetical protein DWB63_07080 [Pseudodesulfovibrio sp. S3]
MHTHTQRTICQCCHNNCGLLVTQEANGKLQVTGDPDHPMNRGRICSKAQANVATLHAPDRLTMPLLKTRGGFAEISWDEALDVAADRLGKIREQHGPLALARFAGAPVSYLARDGFLQFMGAFGSPNLTSIANLCMGPRMMAFRAVTGGIRAEPDYANTDLVLFWGSDPVGGGRFSAYATYDGGLDNILPRLRARGARLVCIDPFHSSTAKTCDQWLRIKPGTDTALGLAMIHVILEEDLYDRDFVAEHGHGLAELKKHVTEFDPAWAEGITGISAETIAKLARDYAGAQAAVIYEGNGLDMYTNGVDAVRSIAILIGLTGNLDTPGGNVFMPMPHPPTLPTAPLPTEQRIGYDRFPLPPQVPFPAIKEALLGEEKNRPRAMIVHHGNPVLIQANSARTSAALKKLDFLMACDIFPTATTALADLVLPMTSTFESYGYRAYSSHQGGFFALGRPVAPPAGEARSVFEVEYQLAEKMNLHQDYPFHDDRSWVEFMTNPSGIEMEEMEAKHIVFATPPIQYRKYRANGFATPSRKVEFSSLWFDRLGAAPLPVYADPAGRPLVLDDLTEQGFTLLGSSRRPTQFVHTKFKNLHALAKAYPIPLVYIHPEDAEARGILDKSEVEVSSPYGKITLSASISEDTKQGLVFVDFGWGNPSDGMGNINDLTDDQHFDPYSGGTPNRLFPCEIIALATPALNIPASNAS